MECVRHRESRCRYIETAARIALSGDPGPVLLEIPRDVATAEVDEKSILDVATLPGASLVTSLPVRAVVLPRIRGGRSQLRRATGAQALLGLAPSTTFQMPYDDGRAVRSLAGLARRVPVYALDVGDDPVELVQMLNDALEDAVSAGVPVGTAGDGAR